MAAALAGFDDVADSKAERFARFVDLRRENAIRIAWRLTGGDRALAEDAAQDAFCEAYRALDRFRGDSSLETWFYRILVRRTRYLVRRQRTWERTLQLFRSVPRTGASAPALEHEVRDRIAEAISSLSASQREVFVLMYLEGFTISRTARLLGRSEGTIKSHLHRALTTLRRNLRDLDPNANEVADDS